MASYTVRVDDASMAVYEAFCSGNVQARIQLLVDGDVTTALAYASQSDEAAKAAKVALAEKWEPAMSAYEKLPKEKQAEVDAILATAADVGAGDVTP